MAPLSAFCCTPYVIFSLTQCNVRHTLTLLLQPCLGTWRETLLLGWATFELLINCLTINAQLQQNTTMLCDWLDDINFHCKYKEPTEPGQDHRSVAACIIRKVYGKKPDHIARLNAVYVWNTAIRLTIQHEATDALRQTVLRAMSVEILSNAAQLNYRNKLFMQGGPIKLYIFQYSLSLELFKIK